MRIKTIKSKNLQNFLVLKTNNKEYKINKDKLFAVLKKLKNINLDLLSDYEILELMDKYCLLEQTFLSWISE
ncbi:MAG: hypothetical protein IKR34_00535 [Candidatus Gastranaerophilales bacterium]|nr:hypothetical protein [Candidatus Gastranaerophilales bacterium]